MNRQNKARATAIGNSLARACQLPIWDKEPLRAKYRRKWLALGAFGKAKNKP